MTGYQSKKKMLGAARLPDTPSARAYLEKVLEDDDTQVYQDHPAQEPVQVSVEEFVHIVEDKEHLVGRPIVWAQWPSEEKNNG